MSISISYFFNSDRALPDLAVEINEALGSNLSPSLDAPDTIFTTFPFFGMELNLSLSVPGNPEWRYEDAGDLKFSDYNYELDLTTYMGQAHARPIQLPLILCTVQALFQRLNIVGMLSYDVDILLAKYAVQVGAYGVNEMFDTLTNTAFHEFGSHLKLIESRIPLS